MKLLALITVLLSLACDSVDASNGDAKGLLRSRKLKGNKNVFSGNTKEFKSPDTGVVGSFLKPDPALGLDVALLKNKILDAFDSCVNSLSSGEVACDIYFNPHTNYSYYRNPSAIGVLRGQLIYNGTTSTDGTTHYFSVPVATSEIMDDLMSDTGIQATGGVPECDGAKYTKLGPGIASAVAEISWKTVVNEITLLSSTITLKKATTKDIRCKYCNVTAKGGDPVDGAALTCTENDADWNNADSYSNLAIAGSHLHTGDKMTDGPPPVFFCKDKPLSPPGVIRFFGDGPGFCLTGEDPVYIED